MIHDSVVSMFVGAHLTNWDRDGDAMAAPLGPVLGRIFKIKRHAPDPQKRDSQNWKNIPKYVGKSNKTFGIPSSKRKLT